MWNNGKLLHNTVLVQDYHNALTMYGEVHGAFKGKTTIKKTDQVLIVMVDKPEQKNIILSIDIMFFAGLSFLVTVSRNIRFITAPLLTDHKKGTIFKAIQQVFRIYQGRGHAVDNIKIQTATILVHTILADNKFQSLKIWKS